MRGWIKIQAFRNSFEADLAKSILDANGIECLIMNAFAASVLVGAVEFELWVHEPDAERALGCLSEAEDAGSEDDEEATEDAGPSPAG